MIPDFRSLGVGKILDELDLLAKVSVMSQANTYDKVPSLTPLCGWLTLALPTVPDAGVCLLCSPVGGSFSASQSNPRLLQYLDGPVGHVCVFRSKPLRPSMLAFADRWEQYVALQGSGKNRSRTPNQVERDTDFEALAIRP